MTTTIDGDSSNSDVTHIDSASTTAYTTTGENTIRVDTTDAAVTITLASADATRDPEHSVLIYDDGGNASNNNISIETEGSETISPGGASSKSITTDHAAFAFEANGTNWNQVNANQEVEQVTVEKASIADLSAVLEKTTDQSISADTDTTVDWDSQDVDTDLYTYTAASDEIDVLEAGDYDVSFHTTWRSYSDQDLFVAKILMQGSVVREDLLQSSGSLNGSQGPDVTATLKDLSANDTIRFDARTDSTGGADLNGSASRTFVTITRSG